MQTADESNVRKLWESPAEQLANDHLAELDHLMKGENRQE